MPDHLPEPSGDKGQGRRAALSHTDLCRPDCDPLTHSSAYIRILAYMTVVTNQTRMEYSKQVTGGFGKVFP